MARRAIIVLGLLWACAAGAQEARPGYFWYFAQPPPLEQARAAVADMEKIARAAGGEVNVWVAEDRAQLRLTAPRAGASFEFPGLAGAPQVLYEPGGAFGEVAAACLLVMRERFDPGVLRIEALDSPDAGAALFRRVLGRAPPSLDRAPAFDDDDDDPVVAGLAHGLGRSWLYPILALGFLWFMYRGGAGWTSYYAFWLVGPMVLFALAAQPLVLLVIPVALGLRRVLPDPFLWLKHLRRIRSLGVDVANNPANAAARRSLAMIWLDMRRPARALPLLDEALARVPDDVELVFLRGQALLGAKRHEDALAAFLRVLEQEPRLRYGEAYLRGADALIALERWEEAEEGLAHFIAVNRSSVEGRTKLARVRRARGDRAGTAAAVAEAKAAYRDSPRFHRRKQLFWYLRAVILGLRRP